MKTVRMLHDWLTRTGKTCIGLLLLLMPVAALAQQVNVTLTLPPPYPIHFEDYILFKNQVLVTLTNLTSTPQQVKLITRVSNDNGQSAFVKPSYTPVAPIALPPNGTMVLTGSQLRSLSTNITDDDIVNNGFKKTEILQTETIPEGLYTVCIRAYDYNSSAPLSLEQLGCANAFIVQYDPPEILVPVAESYVAPKVPQFQNFSWTTSGLPGTTRYKLELVDMTQNGLFNPNDAFDQPGVPVFFTKQNLLTNSFPYSISEPMLTVGHRYAARVTAYDPQNNTNFKNGGKSPVIAFWYNTEGGNNGNQNDPDDPNMNNPNDQQQNPNYAPPCSGLTCAPALPQGPAVTGGFGPGAEVMIGYFKMKIVTVNWAGNQASGQGKIEVPLFNAWVLVDYTNLQLNAEGKALAGKAVPVYDANAQIKAAMKDVVGNTLGITGDDVNNALSFVKQSGKTTDLFNLDLNLPQNLPFAIKTPVLGINQYITLTALEFTPTGAKLNAFAVLPIPEANNKKLGFGAKGICFHPTGLSVEGLQELSMLGDAFTIPFGPNIDMTLKPVTQPGKGTFVRWDCEGFENLQVDGEFLFKNQMLTPLQGDNDGKVKASFLFTAGGWGDFVGKINMEGFQVKGAEGLAFTFEEVLLDYSDLRNLNGIVFPENYQGDKGKTFRGFYFKTIKVKLPKYLKKNGQQVEITLSNTLIDKLGFTGKVAVQPVFSLNEGDVGGWSFSMDKLTLEFVSNSLTGSGFDGKINLPIAETGFGYHCLFSNSGQGLKSVFSIENLSNIEIPMWVAEANLLEGSSLTIDAQGNNVVLVANLSGDLSITGSLPDFPKVDIALPSLEFTHLKVSNKSPYLSCEEFSLASPQKYLNGFEISLNPENEGEGVKVTLNDAQAKVDFGFRIGLHSGQNGISGLTNFSIIGKMTQPNGKQKWAYDKAQMNLIAVDAVMPAFEIHGKIEFYHGDNPTYGKGFRGSLEATFKPLIKASATVQFGKVNNFRYWYVDGKVILNSGIPVGPAVGIYGFGGGAYYHMNIEGLPNYNAMKGGDVDGAPVNMNDPKKSASGTVYVPDQNIAFGLKASVVIGIYPSPTPFNADIAFEANFANGGGLNYIKLQGDGYFMCKTTERQNPKVYAGVKLEYWAGPKVFDGNFQIHFEVGSNGKNILTGDGNIAMHYDPNKWYFLAGTPNDRISIEIFNALKVGSYFMMGSHLPAPAELPASFKNKPGLEGFSLSRVYPMGSSPLSGIAFGQQLEFGSGELKFLIFYASIEFTLGYDVILAKQEGFACEGYPDAGINGWYAGGMAYAGLDFACGIDIDVWFLKTKFEIFSAYLYAAIAVGLPNPTYAEGVVSGGYSVLNGLLKGNFSFHFKAGTKCVTPNDDPFGGLKVIAEIKPMGNQSDIFVAPEVAFNLPLEKEFALQEVMNNGNSKIRKFKFHLKDMKLNRVATVKNGKATNLSQPEPVEGSVFMVQPQLAQFRPKQAFEEFSKYEVKVRVWAEEYKEGAWKTVTEKDNNNTYYEHQPTQNKFVTGERPMKFTDDNIAETYPRKMQRYFHWNDAQNGIIRFESPVDYIFNEKPKDPANWQYKFVARFHEIKSGATEVYETPLQLSGDGKVVSFQLPPSLKKETVHMIQFLVKLDKKGFDIAASNLSTFEETKNIGMGNTTTVTKTKINSTTIAKNEYELYRLFFRTSKYSRFKFKWEDYDVTSTTAGTGNNKRRITQKLTGPEPLDYYDTHPVKFKIGSQNYQSSTLVNLMLDGIFGNFNYSAGVRFRISETYHDYLNHFRQPKYWSSDYGILWANGEANLSRSAPSATAYPLNSEWLNGKLITNGMDLYAIGLVSTGGNDEKLAMNEVNGAFWQNYNPNGNNIGNFGIAEQGGNGLILPNLNLQGNMGGSIEVINDHAHVSYYSRQKLLDGLNHWSSFWGPNKWGSPDYEGMRAGMEHACDDYDLVPKQGKESQPFKVVLNLPGGVQGNGGQYQLWNGTVTY